jgi:hypothetical protein
MVERSRSSDQPAGDRVEPRQAERIVVDMEFHTGRASDPLWMKPHVTSVIARPHGTSPWAEGLRQAPRQFRHRRGSGIEIASPRSQETISKPPMPPCPSGSIRSRRPSTHSDGGWWLRALPADTLHITHSATRFLACRASNCGSFLLYSGDLSTVAQPKALPELQRYAVGLGLSASAHNCTSRRPSARRRRGRHPGPQAQ